MNTKLKLIRFVLAAAIGSLLWAGCASPDTDSYTHNYNHNRPVDFTKHRADTYPERRTGLHDHQVDVYEVPTGVIINEAAAAERPY